MRPTKPTGPHAPNRPQPPWAPEGRPERTRTLPESANTHTADHAEYLSAPAEQQPHQAPRPHRRHMRTTRTRAGPGKLTRTRELPRTGPGKHTCTRELPRTTRTQKQKTPQLLHCWICKSASFPGPVPGRSHVRVSYPDRTVFGYMSALAGPRPGWAEAARISTRCRSRVHARQCT